MSSQNFSVWSGLKGQLWQDTNPPIACRISFWSVPAIVFRLFPLGLRRDLLFTTISWVSGPDSKDLLLIDILSKPRPLTSTATISAGNLWWKRTFYHNRKYHNREFVIDTKLNETGEVLSHVTGNRVTDFWLIHAHINYP